MKTKIKSTSQKATVPVHPVITGGRDEFEFIVIGTGAGGGPVAANLAKAGRRVLVLEAGGDGNNPRSEFKYEVPGSDPRTDPELGWAYWVNSRAKMADRQKQHFFAPGKGLYYPRGTSIGGSTTVNAMIALYPDNGDWDYIAKLTGDNSWHHSAMRNYFERLEQVRYVKPTRDNKERHGFKGWQPLETVGIKNNLCKDKWLAHYVASRVQGEEAGDEFAEAVRTGREFRRDPNNAGDDAHLAVCVALADGVGAGPDFDDAPEESEHEEDSEGGTEALLQAASGTARGLGEDGTYADE